MIDRSTDEAKSCPVASVAIGVGVVWRSPIVLLKLSLYTLLLTVLDVFCNPATGVLTEYLFCWYLCCALAVTRLWTYEGTL